MIVDFHLGCYRPPSSIFVLLRSFAYFHVPTTMPSADMGAFRNLLKQSRNIIVVAGAGLSAASGYILLNYYLLASCIDGHLLGLPTFRGTGGLWRKFGATSLATPEAFEENPSRVWQFYHYRRESFVFEFDRSVSRSLIPADQCPSCQAKRCTLRSCSFCITSSSGGILRSRLNIYPYHSKCRWT